MLFWLAPKTSSRSEQALSADLKEPQSLCQDVWPEGALGANMGTPCLAKARQQCHDSVPCLVQKVLLGKLCEAEDCHNSSSLAAATLTTTWCTSSDMLHVLHSPQSGLQG